MYKLATVKKISLLLIISALLFILGCSDNPTTGEAKKELLIYCGITMTRPMHDIAALFEKRENCIIKIIQGGSGTLHHSIHINQTGDLFLPGSETYLQKCRSEKQVDLAVQVGVNRAALIVAKGNPLGISAELSNLLDNNLRIVLGSAESGSIGKETKRILANAGMYQAAIDRTLYLTNDSKDLSEAIRTEKADLTLNWRATCFWDDNREKVDALPLPETVATPHALILGRLACSKQPELAKRFMDLAASPEGQAIFSDYGLK